MEMISRRSALSLAAAATTLAAAGSEALAQGNALSPEGKLPPGVSRKTLGKRESWIPAYKNVSVLDLIYQPGAKSANGNMPDDMVCQCMEGQLHITKKAEGAQFTAKKGDVWTCHKGDDEAAENTGSTVAIMRTIILAAA